MPLPGAWPPARPVVSVPVRGTLHPPNTSLGNLSWPRQYSICSQSEALPMRFWHRGACACVWWEPGAGGTPQPCLGEDSKTRRPQGAQKARGSPRAPHVPATRTTSADSSASDLDCPLYAQAGSRSQTGTVTYSHAGHNSANTRWPAVHATISAAARTGLGPSLTQRRPSCRMSTPRPPLGPCARVRELPDGRALPPAQPEKRHGPSCRRLSPRGLPVCCPRPRRREDSRSHAGVPDIGPRCHRTRSASLASGLEERAAGVSGVSVQPEGSCPS